MAGLGVVRGLVVGEVGGSEFLDRRVEVFAVGRLVRLEFAGSEAFEELGVLLIGEVVGRDIVRCQCDRRSQRVPPALDPLAGAENIRSILIDWNPVAWRVSNASAASAGKWSRPRVARTTGSQDWTPRLTRVTPWSSSAAP